jgi:hypothetical protein
MYVCMYIEPKYVYSKILYSFSTSRQMLRTSYLDNLKILLVKVKLSFPAIPMWLHVLQNEFKVGHLELVKLLELKC